MCGIAGILRFTQPGEAARAATARPADKAIPEHWLDLLDAAVRQRGPDGRGRFRDRAVRADGAVIDVALVHRRLSILDHACGGQPMVTAPGDLPMGASGHVRAIRPSQWTGAGAPALLHARGEARGEYTPLPHGPSDPLLAVVFNGCIYNHRALRAELQAAGHRFATDHSDTEVLLHGTRHWGEKLHEQLDGMYAYAAWSRRTGDLLLCRDPAGEKPFYTARLAPDTIAFSSSPAGLAHVMAAAGNRAKVDPAGLLLWLKHGYWSRMPLDVQEVSPGACLRVEMDADGIAATPVSRVTDDVHRPDGDLTAPIVQQLLEHAIESRLDADVPIGCFLSGGVDSSIVAALAHRAMLKRGRKLKTFTVQMPDERMDETPFANAVAQHLGTDHAVLICRTSAAADLQTLIGQLGLPFGDSSLLPTHWVSAAAREHVTVALGGDGGDELFAGYNRYFANRAMHRLGAGRVLARVAPGWALKPLGGNLARVANALRHHGYHDILTIFRTPQLRTLWTGPDAEPILQDAYAARNPGPDARHDDFAHYLPEDLMRKVDTAAMAVALEVRAPLLCRPLVAAALGVPLRTVEAGEGRKGLLRQVARALVPTEAIDRRKQGFGAPIGRWFRSDFGGLRALLQERLLAKEPFGPPSLGITVDPAVVRTMVEDHLAERADHPQRLFMLLSLSVWASSFTRPAPAAA